jgi:transcriptional regulator with XRE-family HTH domain
MSRATNLDAAFGEVLREHRKRVGLSQEKLAEAADLHRNFIGLVERGANSPSLRAIGALASALGLRPSDLLTEAESRAEVGRPLPRA